MPEFGLLGGGVIRTVGVTGGASSQSAQLTANASANTKGSYVELTAATEFDANWAFISLVNVSTNTPFLVDLSIGSATEQVIIPDMFAQGRSIDGSYGNYLFPIFIPKGSRLAARCQSATGSATIRLSVTLVAGTHFMSGSGPSWVSAYGATAGSLGTAIDPGGTANTDSAWTEITAATDRAHNWLVVAVRFGDLALSAATSWRLSVGIGSATEQVLVPDLHASGDATADAPANSVWCLPVFIPAGSRLTVKVRSDVTTDGDRDVNVKLYGC